MLKMLRRPVVWQMRGAMYSLGAHDGVPRAMVDRCVGRMKAFVTIAREAVSAEFPDFELSYALRVFDLSAVAAPASADEDLDRVASCLRLDVAALRAQFQDMQTFKICRQIVVYIIATLITRGDICGNK